MSSGYFFCGEMSAHGGLQYECLFGKVLLSGLDARKRTVRHWQSCSPGIFSVRDDRSKRVAVPPGIHYNGSRVERRFAFGVIV